MKTVFLVLSLLNPTLGHAFHGHCFVDEVGSRRPSSAVLEFNLDVDGYTFNAMDTNQMVIEGDHAKPSLIVRVSLISEMHPGWAGIGKFRQSIFFDAFYLPRPRSPDKATIFPLLIFEKVYSDDLEGFEDLSPIKFEKKIFSNLMVVCDGGWN